MRGRKETDPDQRVDGGNRVGHGGICLGEEPIDQVLGLKAVFAAELAPAREHGEVAKVDGAVELTEAFGPSDADTRRHGGKSEVEARRDAFQAFEQLGRFTGDSVAAVVGFDEIGKGSDLAGLFQGTGPAGRAQGREFEGGAPLLVGEQGVGLMLVEEIERGLKWSGRSLGLGHGGVELRRRALLGSEGYLDERIGLVETVEEKPAFGKPGDGGVAKELNHAEDLVWRIAIVSEADNDGLGDCGGDQLKHGRGPLPVESPRTVESEEGKGSQFYFTIPFHPIPMENSTEASMDSLEEKAVKIINIKKVL